MKANRPDYMFYWDFYIKLQATLDENRKCLEDKRGRGLGYVSREDAVGDFYDTFTGGPLTFGYSRDSHKMLLAIYQGDILVAEF